MRAIYRFLFWITGWTVDKSFPDIKKAVIVHAPHTSNLDFFIGHMAFVCYRRKIRILIKKEAFKFPFGGLLKAIGGIPVDRNKKTNLVEQAAEMLHEADDLLILFTPEGTRKFNPDWKTGFYRLAMAAKVPMILVFIDYKKKHGGVGKIFEPTGDVEADIIEMKKFFANIPGKVPEWGPRWPE